MIETQSIASSPAVAAWGTIPGYSLLKLNSATRTLSQRQRIPIPNPVDPQTSKFFSSVPAEVRIQIYHHLLEDLTLNLCLVDEQLRLQSPLQSGNLLSFLLACRQR